MQLDKFIEKTLVQIQNGVLNSKSISVHPTEEKINFDIIICNDRDGNVLIASNQAWSSSDNGVQRIKFSIPVLFNLAKE